MSENLDFTLEHITRSGRPGDRQALAFHGQQAFQGGEKCCCHTSSDGRKSRMFTGFDNIAFGPKLSADRSPERFVEVRNRRGSETRAFAPVFVHNNAAGSLAICRRVEKGSKSTRVAPM